jgi:uncharacterized protein
MVYSSDGFNYLIRLDKGERLTEAIDRFVAETKLDGAWISGLGGALEVTLGYYDLEAKQYTWKTFDGLREISALQGNLAANEEGKMMFHLHGVFSARDFMTVAGHVKDLVAGATVELFIHKLDTPVHRKTDPNVGLQTLDL